MENKEERQLLTETAENGTYCSYTKHTDGFRVQACFDVKKYLIPCVSVNGNKFGSGLEPQGLASGSEAI